MILFEATVRDLSHKGLGVVDHPDGRVFFVRGVWPGDKAVFEVEENALKYAEARLHKLLQTSPDRIEVFCQHRGPEAGKCGGCPWMIARYSSQLEFKTKRLLHALEKRRVSLVSTTINPIIASPQILGYRNRIQLKTNGEEIGFVSEGTSTLAPVENCHILNPGLHQLFHEIRGSLPREDYLPGEGYKWNYIDIDDDMLSSEVVLNRRRPFKQGNTEQNEAMKKWVREKFSTLPRHWPVIDLFCGSGNFTGEISEIGFDNILAIEVQGRAIENLQNKKLSGVRVLPADLMEKGAWAKVARVQPHARALLLDPPREGLERRRGFFKYFDNLEYVFYISCELDTFARDAADFIAHGFSLQEITPIDLFPHTPHVEILSVFHRNLSSRS